MNDVTTAEVDVFDVVAYFLNRDAERGDRADVSPLKLQKLLYFAQANFMASTGHRLFDEDILAYKNGPVFKRVWQRYEGNRVALIHTQGPNPASPRFDRDVEAFLSDIWDTFGRFDADTLVHMTHDQDPWVDNHVKGELDTPMPDREVVDYFMRKAPTDQRVPIERNTPGPLFARRRDAPLSNAFKGHGMPKPYRPLVKVTIQK